MKKDFKNIIITGFALFSIFFGAGNLIFPPTLGFWAGTKWTWVMVGFLIACISLPLFGIVSVAICGGTTDKLTSKVGNKFGKILCTVIMFSIGPLFCIPRTGATTFELGISPLFPNMNPILVSIIYFSITFIFVVNETSVVDKIGAILTPFLLVILIFIIVKAILLPIGMIGDTNVVNPFSKGFTEGYQTMDAIGSIIVAQMVIQNLRKKGYTNKKDQIKMILKSGIISALCLGFVYGGLVYIGSMATNIASKGFTRVELLIFVMEKILGSSSKIIFGIAISVACLTTSVGLTATAGNYFNKLTKNKISYKVIVTIICVFSCVVSNYGVDKIVEFAVPVLVLTYPVVIVLILMSLFDKYIKNKGIYEGAVYVAFGISLLSSLKSIGIKIDLVVKVLKKLPLNEYGFAWIVPAIIGAILGGIFLKEKNVKKSSCEEVI